MPGPWGTQRPQFGIGRRQARAIEGRAMQLRHLRDLKQYIMRLCKTRLLRYPDHHFNRSRGKSGTIKWSVIAQHEITSEIIKRIIPEEHSCSWSELVSPDEAQKAELFCSHSWSEAFREFMASIERFVEECDATADTGFWSEFPPPVFCIVLI